MLICLEREKARKLEQIKNETLEYNKQLAEE